MNGDFVRVARVARLPLAAFGVVAMVTLAACGGDDSSGPNSPRTAARVSPDSQTTAAGVKMAQPLVVLVTGSGGAPLAGIPVEWAIGTGGGSLSDTVTTTDAAGHAQTTYTPGTLPTVAHVTASVGGLPGVVFTITLVAGPPSTLQKFGSDNPAAVVGSKLTLSVKLVDQFNNAISGTVVNWAAAGGSVSAATSTTDTGGVAAITYTLGNDPGTYSLTATVVGVPPATFSVRAIP